MSKPEPKVYFGGSDKLNDGWRAGQRFIAALGKAVWTQKGFGGGERMKHITRNRNSMPRTRQVRKMLRDEKYVDEDSLPIGTILVLSAWVGEDEDDLSKESGLPLEEVKEICGRLKESGVFGKGHDHYADYIDSFYSGIMLSCDSACGRGFLTRVMRDGNAAWVITDAGAEYTKKLLLSKSGKKP